MSRNRTAKDCFHYRQSHKGENYCKSNFWQPGEPVTEKDRELLKPITDFYQKEGYAPSRSELPHSTVSELKARFRIWKNVILAAELPDWNDVEAQERRKEKRIQ